jgi:hypothetical protein
MAEENNKSLNRTTSKTKPNQPAREGVVRGLYLVKKFFHILCCPMDQELIQPHTVRLLWYVVHNIIFHLRLGLASNQFKLSDSNVVIFLSSAMCVAYRAPLILFGLITLTGLGAEYKL